MPKSRLCDLAFELCCQFNANISLNASVSHLEGFLYFNSLVNLSFALAELICSHHVSSWSIKPQSPARSSDSCPMSMYTVQAPTWGTTRQLKQVAKLILYQLLTTIAIQFFTQFSPRIGFHLTPAGKIYS